MFSWGLLHSALLAAQAQGFAGITDEASAVEAQGHAPRLVRGSTHNIKVTWPEDFALAEALIRSRS
jgi:2-C-methyl-D-erythritol 4-phosphate cytidylyltransferase